MISFINLNQPRSFQQKAYNLNKNNQVCYKQRLQQKPPWEEEMAENTCWISLRSLWVNGRRWMMLLKEQNLCFKLYCMWASAIICHALRCVISPAVMTMCWEVSFGKDPNSGMQPDMCSSGSLMLPCLFVARNLLCFCKHMTYCKISGFHTSSRSTDETRKIS